MTGCVVVAFDDGQHCPGGLYCSVGCVERRLRLRGGCQVAMAGEMERGGLAKTVTGTAGAGAGPGFMFTASNAAAGGALFLVFNAGGGSIQASFGPATGMSHRPCGGWRRVWPALGRPCGRDRLRRRGHGRRLYRRGRFGDFGRAAGGAELNDQPSGIFQRETVRLDRGLQVQNHARDVVLRLGHPDLPDKMVRHRESQSCDLWSEWA